MYPTDLKYTKDHQPVITGIERVSRPGRRRYVNHAARAAGRPGSTCCKALPASSWRFS